MLYPDGGLEHAHLSSICLSSLVLGFNANDEGDFFKFPTAGAIEFDTYSVPNNRDSLKNGEQWMSVKPHEMVTFAECIRFSCTALLLFGGICVSDHPDEQRHNLRI
ncbi:hypothetical protein TNCV_5087661 [Trichonephila clavipes]|nr:hypothetical protein TNCV_5087661 [Trichonephila clavipes]